MGDIFNINSKTKNAYGRITIVRRILENNFKSNFIFNTYNMKKYSLFTLLLVHAYVRYLHTQCLADIATPITQR